MPQKVEIDGKEVEVFSKEELDAKNTELETAKANLKAKEEELEKLNAKDFNFKKLEASRDAADKNVEDLKKEIDTKITAAKTEVLEEVNKDHYDNEVKAVSASDEELKKKVELHYSETLKGVVPKNKAEISAKVRQAWVLATTKEDPGALNASVISSGGVGALNIKTEKKFSPEEKAVARKIAAAGGLELTDADFGK